MKKTHLVSALAAALLLSAGATNAENKMADMEKCKVVKDGKGMIKEHKGDCKTSKASCSGNNTAGDPEAWIMVPKGECDKINKGDFSSVSQDVKDKIEGAK